MALRVRSRCVKAVLRARTAAGEDSDIVAQIAERSRYSPRTVYRVMEYPDDKLITLDQADRLLLAADGHLSVDCTEEDLDGAD